MCLHVYLCTMYVPVPQGGQRTLDAPGLELQMVTNCQVHVENPTQVVWRRSQCS